VARAFVLCLGMLAGLALGAQPAPSNPTPAEKELQAPLSLEDGKPTAPPPGEGSGSGLRAFGSLLLVLGVAGGSLWALRRYGLKRFPGSGGTRLKVEETLALGDRRFVSILRADEERFLIALAPTGIALLARLDSSETGETGSFDQALARAEEITGPVSVREVEARLREAQP
jgi:flagellar protein FliO/FliZ